MPKKKEVEKTVVSTDLKEIRSMLRKEITKKYGGVREFLRSEDGQKLGGMRVRTYLYDSGAMNYKFISSLCKLLGVGEFTRKNVVTRTVTYSLTK